MEKKTTVLAIAMISIEAANRRPKNLSTAEISGAIIELLQDRNILEHYSIRSRFIAKKEYNQQEIRQKTMGVIEYVANRRNRDIL